MKNIICYTAAYFTFDILKLNEITNITNTIINVPYLPALSDSSQPLKQSTLFL
jgi:hypothetical protein